MNFAFQISEEDVENVLRNNWKRVVNTNGRSFKDMSEQLYLEVDEGAVEKAALKSGNDLETQTDAAYAKIARQLITMGVLSNV